MGEEEGEEEENDVGNYSPDSHHAWKGENFNSINLFLTFIPIFLRKANLLNNSVSPCHREFPEFPLCVKVDPAQIKMDSHEHTSFQFC